MRTTSSYRRSWPGRRLLEAALETPEPAMRQSCAAERAAGGSFCRTGRGCPVDHLPCRPPALAKELAGPGAGAVMGTRPAGSWGKSPFGRMGRLHYRTCVRVQGAVPTVVPAVPVPVVPAAWTRCSRWRWPAYRTPPWPPTWWGCGSRSPDWSRSSPASWWSSTAAGGRGHRGGVHRGLAARGLPTVRRGGRRAGAHRPGAGRDLPVTADALAAGDLSYAHARVL